MGNEAIILIILALAIAAFVWNRLPVGSIALGVALGLWATGVLSLEEAYAGFSNPTVVLIAALFVVAEGLDAAGVTTWAGELVVRYAGDNPKRLVILIMVAIAILSALITPNGAVAALYPMVVVLAVRSGNKPSKLLMPAAFAAHAGALFLLTGSPVTLLTAQAAADSGGGTLGYFTVALTGIPLLIGTIVVSLYLGPRLLPDRTPKTFSRDLSTLPTELKGQYLSDQHLLRFRTSAHSPLIGLSTAEVQALTPEGVRVVSIVGSSGSLLIDDKIAQDTQFVIRGAPDAIATFVQSYDLEPLTNAKTGERHGGLVTREFGVAEVIITPRSDYIGDYVFPGMVTDSGNLVVLAVQRLGTDLGISDIKLKAGDSLLLQGSWQALDEHTVDPNVVLVDNPDAIRRQTIALGSSARPALLILGAMIVLLSTGFVPASVACLLAAMAMIILRILTVDQAHRSMSWSTLLLVAGMIPLSTAITNSGMAKTIASSVIDLIGAGGPYLIMTALFIITAVLGQMISNTATALILIPVVISIAAEGGYSPMTLLMCLNVAAAASLLTPIATPANLMVMEPAGYRFSDYWKFGLPVMAVYFVIAVVLVPIIWPL